MGQRGRCKFLKITREDLGYILPQQDGVKGNRRPTGRFSGRCISSEQDGVKGADVRIGGRRGRIVSLRGRRGSISSRSVSIYWSVRYPFGDGVQDPQVPVGGILGRLISCLGRTAWKHGGGEHCRVRGQKISWLAGRRGRREPFVGGGRMFFYIPKRDGVEVPHIMRAACPCRIISRLAGRRGSLKEASPGRKSLRGYPCGDGVEVLRPAHHPCP